MGANPFTWAFLSGIEANHTGTGRFMAHLQTAVLARPKIDGTIVYCPKEQALTDAATSWLSEIPHLVVFHPQMVGVTQVLALIQRRARAGKRTHLYLLDSFFFCLKSYNHLDHETAPCFRCVGEDQGVNAVREGCVPWPARDPEAATFIRELFTLVRADAVHLLAQNRKQAELVRRHFGNNAGVTVVGLWCADWTAYVDDFCARGEASESNEPAAYDVVYHGSRDPAKGIGWVLEVAARTPELRYLVPIDRGSAEISAPSNVTVAAMRWESGLHDAVGGARLVLAPSLWSSPCEGALIKSIVIARATGVVDVPSAFSSEIPSDVVLKLPAAPDEGATAIRDAFREQWKPNVQARHQWVQDFRASNIDVAQKLFPQI